MIAGTYETAHTIKNFCYAKYNAFNSKLAEIVNSKAIDILIELAFLVPCLSLHYNVCVIVGLPLGYFLHNKVKEVEEDMVALYNLPKPYFGKITITAGCLIVFKFMPQAFFLTSIYISAKWGARIKNWAENGKNNMPAANKIVAQPSSQTIINIYNQYNYNYIANPDIRINNSYINVIKERN